MSVPFMYILNSLQFLLLLPFCQVCMPFKETAEIENGVAEKSSLDQGNIRQKQGLVWRNRKKISQIIKDYFYLPFFLLIILWFSDRGRVQCPSLPGARAGLLAKTCLPRLPICYHFIPPPTVPWTKEL